MKSVIFLALAATLGSSLAGCESYQDRQYADYQRHTDEGFYNRDGYAQPYTPARSYYSRDDYYRHYNGIDG